MFKGFNLLRQKTPSNIHIYHRFNHIVYQKYGNINKTFWFNPVYLLVITRKNLDKSKNGKYVKTLNS